MTVIKIDKDIPVPTVAVPEVTTGIPVPRQKMGELPINEDGLTSREEKFVNAVMNGKKGTLTKTVQAIYEEEGKSLTDKSASVRTAELRKSSGVMAVLGKAAETAEADIVEIAQYSKALGKSGGKEGASYAGVALSANKEILDRVHGKAKQSIDVTTKSVTINMDLTQNLPSET